MQSFPPFTASYYADTELCDLYASVPTA